MLRSALAALALLANTSVGCATSAPAAAAPVVAPARAPLNADAATEQLLHATVFEDQAVSYDGHESDGVRAFRAIYAEPDAAARFARIAQEGTLVGKLYAAVGLRHHDPAAYAALKSSLLAQRDTRVDAQFGCDGLAPTVGELVESTGPNAIRLAEGESVEAWLAVHKSGELDIYGGGYTAMFAPR